MTWTRVPWLLMSLLVLGCEAQRPTHAEAPPNTVVEPTPGADAEKASAAAGEPDHEPAAEPDRVEAKPVLGSASLEDARAFLQEFLKPGADLEGLTRQVVPQPGDYARVFEGELASKARQHYERMFADPNAKIGPKAGQTELVLFAATTEELRAGTGDALEFPGGYKRVADQLAPGVTWFRFKFVKPGERAGMAFDGLTFIDGRWAMFPKPWRIK